MWNTIRFAICSTISIIIILGTISGCDNDIVRVNPYDPESDNTIIGGVSGTVSPATSNALVSAKRGAMIYSSGRIGNNGRFMLNRLPEGIYIIIVEANNFKTDSSLTDIQVTGKTIIPVGVIFLNSAIHGTITGKVEPFSMNTIIRLFQDGIIIDSTNVNESSIFSFSMLEPGEYEIEISLENYTIINQHPILVSGGVTTNLGTIVLNDMSKGSITGIISPRSSQAIVYLMQGTSNLDSTIIDPLTGQYLFTNLEPTSYDIQISAHGYARAFILGIEVIAGETDDNNNYLLEETGEIIGTIYPVNSNALVTVYHVDEQVAEFRINPIDGRYRITDLSPEYYSLSISSEGWISDVSFDLIRVDAGSIVKLDRIYIARNGSNIVYGKVTDINSGNPITSAIVNLAGNSSETDIEGYYSFSNAPSGLKNVLVQKTGYLSSVTQINIPSTGSSSNNIILTPSGSLNGYVRDSISGNGIVNVRISIDNGDFATFSEINGNYSFEHLPAGNHSISYTKDEYNSTNEQIIIIMGSNSSLDVSMVPFSSNRGSLSGHVRNYYTDANIADATIIIAGMVGRSNDQGLYRIDYIPIGNQIATIEHADYLRQTDQISIQANRVADLNFGLVPKDSLNAGSTGTLTGTLRDDDTGAIIDYAGEVLIFLSYIYNNTAPAYLYNKNLIENGNFQIFNMVYDGGSNPNYDTPNIPIGVYHLWTQEYYSSSIGAYGYKGFDLLVEVQEGNNHVDVRLQSLCSIGGIISDAVSGESVEEVRILGVSSEENGVYYQNRVDPEIIKITTLKYGYYGEDFDVTLVSGQHNNIDFCITPLPKVRGTIRNGANGQVLSGVEVSSSRAETTTSNDAGIYEIQFNNEGYSSLNFAKPGFHNHTIFLNIPHTGTTTIDVELIPN